MIKRGAHKICKLIIGGSAFTFFTLQSCSSHDTHNYGGEPSKPAENTANNNKVVEQIRESQVRESQRAVEEKRETKNDRKTGSRRGDSPTRKGCF